jgi:DNA repair protein RadA/Sms
MAVASSAFDKPVPKGTVFIGEIGLSGELRPVGHMESRIREARKMGFTQAIIPEANRDTLSQHKGIDLIARDHVKAALTILT